jgi:indole-3-glycerol phosphate synthase
MNFLKEIIEQKRERVAEARRECGDEEMRSLAFDARRDARPHLLRDALGRRDRVNIIAEVKRASPSKGVIRADTDAAQIARSYEAGGASAVSVLTEEGRFKGSVDDLRAVRRAVTLPVLRKDFIFDEYQLYEAAAAGADALLLIVAALDDEQLARLRRITEDNLQMDALVEVHTEDEMRRAQLGGATIIGVNNRNLRTFEVTIETSVKLARSAPDKVLLVSESGLRDWEDLKKLRALGYHGFLIGETLMRAAEPERALRDLIAQVEE